MHALVNDIYVTLFRVQVILAELPTELPDAELIFLSRLVPGFRHIKNGLK
jgi:hypothetical protein